MDIELLIQALKQYDFEVIVEKGFQQIAPIDLPSREYEGLLALRDTVAKALNDFIVGVVRGTLIWFKSHDISATTLLRTGKRIFRIESLS